MKEKDQFDTWADRIIGDLQSFAQDRIEHKDQYGPIPGQLLMTIRPRGTNFFGTVEIDIDSGRKQDPLWNKEFIRSKLQGVFRNFSNAFPHSEGLFVDVKSDFGNTVLKILISTAVKVEQAVSQKGVTNGSASKTPERHKTITPPPPGNSAGPRLEFGAIPPPSRVPDAAKFGIPPTDPKAANGHTFERFGEMDLPSPVNAEAELSSPRKKVRKLDQKIVAQVPAESAPQQIPQEDVSKNLHGFLRGKEALSDAALERIIQQDPDAGKEIDFDSMDLRHCPTSKDTADNIRKIFETASIRTKGDFIRFTKMPQITSPDLDKVWEQFVEFAERNGIQVMSDADQVFYVWTVRKKWIPAAMGKRKP